MSGQAQKVTVILAGPAERRGCTRGWYQTVTADPRFAVIVVAETVEELRGQLYENAPDVLVVYGKLFRAPGELEEVVSGLRGTAVYVVLPSDVSGETEARVKGLHAVKMTGRGEVELGEVLGKMYADGLDARARGGARQARSVGATRPAVGGAARLARGGGRIVAVWSGTAGGTGCTTLALALAGWVAEQGSGAVLLALAEPAVSVAVRCDRVPNATTFFQTGDLGDAVRTLTWDGGTGLPVVLGPARPAQGVVEPGQVGRLVEAAWSSYPLVIVDVPTLTPGGSPWVVEPLVRATDVVLVVAPTRAGVAAVLEALATLRDAEAGARVHLVLNRVVEHLSARGFTSGVSEVWGWCPDVVMEIAHEEELAKEMGEGELPHVLLPVGELAQAVGLARPVEEEKRAGGRIRLRVR